MHSFVKSIRSQVTHSSPVNTCEISAKTEPFGSGVRTLLWDSEGYHLIAVSNGTTTLADFTFCKSILCSSFAQSKSSDIILQTTNKLLRFHMSSGMDFVSADWEPLQIPLSYLTFNYPIENVAISGDRNHIALSGSRGCVIYSGTSKKWRMFGNLEQEYQVKCSAMVWIDNVILALVSINDQNESELLLYPRTHLDEVSRLERRVISQSKILFIDSTSVLLRITQQQMKLVPIIFMYDESMKLHIYTCPIDYDKNNNIQVKLTKLEIMDMTQFHTSIPRSMVSVSCKSTTGVNASETKKLLSSVRLLFVHANGDLGAFKLHGTQKEFILENGVDGLWIEQERSYNDKLIYFTFNGKSRKGTDMSIVDLSLLPKINHIRVKNIIPFDTEAVPMGVLKDFGVFLQISETVKQRLSAHMDVENTHSQSRSKLSVPSSRFNSRDLLFMENPLGFPYYEMQPKMYPYVHGLLLGLLFEQHVDSKAPTESVSENVDSFESLVSFTKQLPPHKNSALSFVANLEWMLHCALGSTDSSTYLSIERSTEEGVFSRVDMRKCVVAGNISLNNILCSLLNGYSMSFIGLYVNYY